VKSPDDPGRDDLGREDDSPGFDVQARIFAGLGAFLSAVSIFYGFLTYEWAGTTMLALTSGLMFTIGAYVGWQKPGGGTSVDDAEPVPAGPGSEAAEPWFPAASVWPFAVGLALVLVGNGLLLGTWLLLPAAALLVFALGGFVVQARRRA